MNNLTDWLDYLNRYYTYSQGGTEEGFANFQKITSHAKLNLFTCPVITVTGTNGKGSCVVFLEQILLAQGYKVGAYLSPHLLKFNERIRLNGCEVNDQDLGQAFSSINDICQGTNITYFEFITLAAFKIFQDFKPDILILEVGLGGRLDAVNVVDADIAVITTIAFDHTQQLGNTLDEIAFEKAGIMRPHKYAVCGEQVPPQSLIDHARKLATKLYCFNRDYHYVSRHNYWCWVSREIKIDSAGLAPRTKQWGITKGERRSSPPWASTGIHSPCAVRAIKYDFLPLPKLPLPSAAIALMVIELLPKVAMVKIEQSAIVQGLTKAFLPGRFQQILANPKVIVDVAHNPSAASLLATKIKSFKLIQRGKPCAKIFGVVGMLNDKDIRGTLLPLVDLIDGWYLGGLNIPRGATCEILAKKLQEFDQKVCYTHRTVNEAYDHAIVDYTKGLVVVFGSFYTVASVINHYQKLEE